AQSMGVDEDGDSEGDRDGADAAHGECMKNGEHAAEVKAAEKTVVVQPVIAEESNVPCPTAASAVMGSEENGDSEGDNNDENDENGNDESGELAATCAPAAPAAAAEIGRAH